MKEAITKVDEFGAYYVRTPFNHDAEVKVKNQRQEYWERFYQNGLKIEGPIRRCIESAVVLGLAEDSELGRRSLAKELGGVTTFYYPGGGVERFLEDVAPEVISQRVTTLNGRLQPVLGLMVDNDLILSRARREQQRLANKRKSL